MLRKKKNPNSINELGFKYGGRGEIRTHGTLRFVGFQDRCNRPLCHSSVDLIKQYCNRQNARFTDPNWLALQKQRLQVTEEVKTLRGRRNVLALAYQQAFGNAAVQRWRNFGNR